LADYELAFKPRFEFKNTLIGEIPGVKVDFIRHNYPYIDKPQIRRRHYLSFYARHCRNEGQFNHGFRKEIERFY
jgi:hypothetical protein